MADFTTENVLISDLKPHPKNYVVHPDDEIEHIATSILQHGIYKNIVVANDNTILAGHGVVIAAKKVGKESVPVYRLDIGPDDPLALKVLVGDNEIRHLAAIDDYGLSNLLMQIKDSGLDGGLSGTGYDGMMLANLIFTTRPESEVRDFNAAAEWVGVPEFKPDDEPFRITVSFRSVDDIQEFARLLSLDVSEKTHATWYPPRPKDDTASLRFQ